MRYVSLHHHSTYSYLDGYALPEAHIRRAADLEMGALALTEHGNVSSHVKLEQAGVGAGVKPIFGCELYCGAVNDDRTQRKNHLTVLAATPEGYRNLMTIVSQGWSNYYYEPTVDGETLARYKKGLIILSGCTGSLLATSLIGGKNIDPADASYKRARSVARRFKKVFGDAYYLEVQAFPELEKSRIINTAYERLSQELGIPLCATGDVHYTKPEENEMQMILHNVRGGNKKSLEDMSREWGYDVPLCPPTTDRSVYDRLRATGLSKQAAIDAIVNTELIASRCNVELPKLERIRFPIEAPFKTSHEVWLAWLKEGWAFRGMDKLPQKRRNEYARKLKYEMSIIEQKEFIDYFLVVSDAVKHAKDKGIPVGPARGSAAASLVCFLLRITEVDPMLFPNLVFERFIDITRMDLPDIDLDFDDERRIEVRNYLVSKYGVERVSNIGTFTQYKSKNSLDDVARVYKIPAFEVEKVKELLLERSSGDLRASATIEDTVAQFDEAKAVFEKYPELVKSQMLEGNVKGMGVHAAGLVVSSDPIQQVCAVYAREVQGVLTEVISLDKYDAEYLNVLKIDVLGLSTMGMIRIALEMIDMHPQDLYDLPLDDPVTIEGFRINDTIGIFQFDGRAMRSVNAQLRPDNFQEVCDVNALARPGPLHSGASSQYIDKKRGLFDEKLHPLMEDIVKGTNGQIIYQEQILRIVMEIGKFDWTHAAYIRKIISRKLGEQEFSRQWEKFRDGAVSQGISEKEAKDIWGHCITAGSYAFNAAHCVSYGMLAYWTMWLKQHHPIAFYVAALRKYEPKQLDILRDAVKHDIAIDPPSYKHSQVEWTGNIKKRRIIGGFSQIPGIGKKMSDAIIDYRTQHGFSSWDDLVKVKGIGKKTLDSKILPFVKDEDPFRIFWLRKRIDKVKQEIIDGKLGNLPVPTHRSEEIPYERGTDVEVVWLGQITNKNLRELFEFNFSRTGVPLDPETVKDPHLNEWVLLRGFDESEMISINIDRWKYPSYRKVIWEIKESDLVLVHGVKAGFQSFRNVKATRLWVIDPDEE